MRIGIVGAGRLTQAPSGTLSAIKLLKEGP